MALVCLLAILVTSPWGVIITYINERFVTDVRATGFGIGFSLSVIIPSFYAFYMNWLGAIMPFELTPVVLLAVGAIIGMIGAPWVRKRRTSIFTERRMGAPVHRYAIDGSIWRPAKNHS